MMLEFVKKLAVLLKMAQIIVDLLVSVLSSQTEPAA